MDGVRAALSIRSQVDAVLNWSLRGWFTVDRNIRVDAELAGVEIVDGDFDRDVVEDALGAGEGAEIGVVQAVSVDLTALDTERCFGIVDRDQLIDQAARSVCGLSAAA